MNLLQEAFNGGVLVGVIFSVVIQQAMKMLKAE